MSVRLQLAIMVGLMINAILFGIGIVTILSIPVLADNAKYSIPVLVVACFTITPFIAWLMAPRLRLRYWQDREQARKQQSV
ncbi:MULTISPECIES: hypothetical protein [unclassified Ensifer]|uniref:hypothetical protein n=1 Tax=unclassified Ensifer TaxID=2633371 RepID=UPI0008131F30|nr:MULTISPECIES: hypothetical protein [unclassified Ensifer]OCP03929.1 hypothetical protein BBX50_26380 [Ensifer sp. LC11]OCP04370.1 hypothetical protein BC374_26390 [Ensifer sp. LC13]OCP08526.1 hypothetical protein BC362_01880 [Ensifer sp. LC14]OCP30390.1 hypothetical protein BC364_26270 [Ensifer sp. LC499]